MDGSVVPMTMGSNILCQGIYTLLDDIIKYFPSPENREIAGVNLKTNEIIVKISEKAEHKEIIQCLKEKIKIMFSCLHVG